MNIGDLFMRVLVDDKAFATDLNAKAGKAGDKAGATMGQRMSASVKKTWSGAEIGKGLTQGFGLAGGLGAAHLFATAIGKIGNVLGDANEAALAEEESIARLASSLRASVPDWDGNTEAIERVIKSRMALGFADDEQRESMALTIGATKDETKALALQRTAMDLARFKKISLAEATQALIKIEGGQFRALKGLIGSTKDITTAEQAMAAVMRVAGGAAEDLANTNRGKLLASQIEVDEAMEELGAVTMPAMVAVMGGAADAATELAGHFAGLIAETEKEVKALEAVGTAAEDEGAKFLDSLTFWDGWTTGASEAVDKTADATQAGFDRIVGDLDRGVAGMTGLTTTAEESTDRVIESFEDMTSRLGSDIDKLIGTVYDPAIQHADLLATKAEMADLRRVISSKKSTNAEIADAKRRMLTLTKNADETRSELLESGNLTAKETAEWLAELRKKSKKETGAARAAIDLLIARILALGKVTAAGINVVVRGPKTRNVDRDDIRDAGGPTEADKPYWIGLNRRPELMVPGAGHILTQAQAVEAVAGDASAGKTWQITVNNPEPRAAEDDIGRMARRLESLGL